MWDLYAPEGIQTNVNITSRLFRITWPKILIGALSIVAAVGVVLGVLFSSQGSPNQQNMEALSAPNENSNGQDLTSQPGTAYAGIGASSSKRIDIAQYPEFKPRFISKDIFRPIYDPKFVSAEMADLEDNDFVIGLAINGDARGYPIGPLTRHEMVNDVVGGIPVLITW